MKKIDDKNKKICECYNLDKSRTQYKEHLDEENKENYQTEMERKTSLFFDEENINLKINSYKKKGYFIFVFSSFQLLFYFGYKNKFGNKIGHAIKKIINFCSKIIYSEILSNNYKHVKNFLFISFGIGISVIFITYKFQKIFLEYKNKLIKDKEDKTIYSENDTKQNLNNSFKFDKQNPLEQEKSINYLGYDKSYYVNERSMKNDEFEKNKSPFKSSHNKIQKIKENLFHKHFYRSNKNFEKKKSYCKKLLETIPKTNNFLLRNNSKHSAIQTIRKSSKRTNNNLSHTAYINITLKDFESDDSYYSNIYDFKKFQVINIELEHKKNTNLQKTNLNNKNLIKDLNYNDNFFRKKDNYSNKLSCVNNIKFSTESKNSQSKHINDVDNTYLTDKLCSSNIESIRKINSSDINHHYLIDKNDAIAENFVVSYHPNIYENKNIAYELEKNNTRTENLSREILIKQDFMKKSYNNPRSEIIESIKINDKNSKIIMMQFTKPKF